MRHQNSFTTAVLAATLIFSGNVGMGPATAPTTTPSTRPDGVAIHGSVSLSGGIALQKPDLTRAVVYLASDPQLDSIPVALDHATVAQKDKAFVPNFIVVARGTDVEFPNWDSFDHNVFSRSKAAPAFDLDRYPRGQSKTRTFDKVGVVQVFCNIHPSMRAIIFVAPNVYFARCNADGTFELRDVPSGNYELVAWQERCAETRQEIAVGSEDLSGILLSLSENRQSVIANDLAKHGSSYGIGRGLGVKREHLDLPVVKDSHASVDPEK